jgi:hypothetical protein
MPAARRVQLVPPTSLTEAQLIERARGLSPPDHPVRPGDEVGGLVVLRVEPEAGATLGPETELEVLPAPRRRDAPSVDIAILLDVGKSMAAPWDARHTRMEAALAALRPFLASPGESIASIAVHEFAKTCRLAAGPSPAGGATLPPPSPPRGTSETGAALDAVLAELAARSGPERSQVVLLLADGVGGSVDALRLAAWRAARLEVPVHALVFAPEVDPAFEEVAHASGGSAQQASYPLLIEFVHQPGA